jgi:hypothetical protein
MNRRTLLAGVGGLTAVGAGALGTGAFTSVTAERTVDVQVAGDAAAYLALDDIDSEPNSEYVDATGDTVEITLDQTAAGGQGLNKQATTRIDNILQVSNQGTQEVAFWLDTTVAEGGIDGDTSTDDADYLTVEGKDEVSSGSLSSTQLAYDGTNSASLEPLTVPTGEDIVLNVVIESVASSTDFTNPIAFIANEDGSAAPATPQGL